jgi:hypothetical protein
MAENSTKRPRISPLKQYALEPITDPAEFAALDRKFREAENRTSKEGEAVIGRPEGKKAPKNATPAGVRKMYEQLPMHARLELLTRLAAELSSEEQRRLVQQLLSQLSSDAR